MSSHSLSDLNKELDDLKKLADEQSHHFRSARSLLYEGLSRVYLLWQKATRTQGLLEEMYKEHGIQFKREIQAEVNFSPLLRYLWDMDGTLNSNTIDQWNRALNKLHTHYIGNKEFYRTAVLSKLISFFTTSGGITKLAAYSSSFAEDVASPNKRKLSINLERKRASKHIEMGRSFYARHSGSLASFVSRTTLPTADGDLAVGIIRKARRGYSLIDVVDDKDLIDAVVVHAYTRDNSHTPYPLRFLLETIKTQCPPYYMRGMNRSLNEPSRSTNDKGQRVSRLRRLLFMAKENVFLLSTTRGDCSTVTIAYPRVEIIRANVDTFLSQNDRNFIEEEVIFTRDENLISTDCDNEIMPTSDEVASHKMFLSNSVTHKSRFLRFYPITSYKSESSKVQTILQRGVKIPEHFTTEVSRDWLKELNGKYLSRWITGFGKAIKRKEYAVQKLAFGRSGLTFHFIQRGNDYDDLETVPFTSASRKKPIAVEVLSKDLIPPFHFLSNADLVGNVRIRVCAHLIRLDFQTSTAAYLIAIPTCNHAGKRDETLFQSYGGEDEKLK